MLLSNIGRLGSAVAGAGVALLVVLAGPSMASATTSDTASNGATAPDNVTRVEVKFSHPVSLADAISAAKPHGERPVAYRIEGSGVVAEWAPGSQTASAFISNFKSNFAIEPEVVGYLVEKRLPSVKAAARAGKLPTRSGAVAVNAPVFHSSPVPEVKRRVLKARGIAASSAQSAADAAPSQEAKAVTAAALTHAWWATSGHFELYRAGNYEYITTHTTYSSAAHKSIPAGFGMEIGVDLYNNATGTRGGVPLCGPNFRDQFIAKNYDWPSWQAYSPTGDVAAARPYADYNGLYDSCGRNAMTIGFQYGNKIPGTQLDTVIQAPKGVAGSSQLGAGLQLVDNQACTPIETNGVGGATDCMGILQLTPSGIDPNMVLLAKKSHTSVDYHACWDTTVTGGVPHATWLGNCGF